MGRTASEAVDARNTVASRVDSSASPSSCGACKCICLVIVMAVDDPYLITASCNAIQMKQAAAAQHGWPLDSVTVRTEVLTLAQERRLSSQSSGDSAGRERGDLGAAATSTIGQEDGPGGPTGDEGIVVSGLFLVGAQWDAQRRCLREAAPNHPPSALPLLRLRAHMSRLALQALEEEQGMVTAVSTHGGASSQGGGGRDAMEAFYGSDGDDEGEEVQRALHGDDDDEEGGVRVGGGGDEASTQHHHRSLGGQRGRTLRLPCPVYEVLGDSGDGGQSGRGSLVFDANMPVSGHGSRVAVLRRWMLAGVCLLLHHGQGQGETGAS